MWGVIFCCLLSIIFLCLFSRAELAAIAAAIIYGSSHIVTDTSLTSMHQIKIHIQTSTATTSREISSNPLQKAIHQSPLPIHFYKEKSHAGIIGNE